MEEEKKTAIADTQALVSIGNAAAFERMRDGLNNLATEKAEKPRDLDVEQRTLAIVAAWRFTRYIADQADFGFESQDEFDVYAKAFSATLSRRALPRLLTDIRFFHRGKSFGFHVIKTDDAIALGIDGTSKICKEFERKSREEGLEHSFTEEHRDTYRRYKELFVDAHVESKLEVERARWRKEEQSSLALKEKNKSLSQSILGTKIVVQGGTVPTNGILEVKVYTRNGAIKVMVPPDSDVYSALATLSQLVAKQTTVSL